MDIVIMRIESWSWDDSAIKWGGPTHQLESPCSSALQIAIVLESGMID
jgi:hypothetical protein